MTNTEWFPAGRVSKLLDVMRTDPERVFMVAEAARIMGCSIKYVHGAIKYAVANKAMFCKGFGPGVPMLMRGSPFPDGFNAIPRPSPLPRPSQTWKEGKERKAEPGWLTRSDDHRIAKVDPTWKAPVMRHVRGGQ